MLDNLATQLVAVAIIIGVTFPIWFLVLLARFVRHVGRIARTLEDLQGVYWSQRAKDYEQDQRKVANSMFGR